MSRLFFLFLSLLIAGTISAQRCGTPWEPMIERVEANKKIMTERPRGAVKYIPVTFHMVADANGNGRVEIENVLKQVANINEQYADQEVIFYIDRFNSFDNNAVYNTPSTSAARIQMRAREDNNSINVFICNTADNGGGGAGVTLAYYDPQDDWIVSRKGEINGASSTLSHEVGHFFSLPHPFSGFECNPYLEADYGNPVTLTHTIPCEGGGGSNLIELHDRSNCNTAGDRICDTPEDYNLGLLFQNDCAPNTYVKDRNNETITPMTNNFMSYYTDCADYEFTPTQKNLMNTDYNTPQRAYIRQNNTPNTTPVTEPVTYLSPISGQQSNGLEDVLLDWEDTPGANQYLVMWARNSSFTIEPHKELVTTSEYIIPETLSNGLNYYWRVWPFNETQTAAMYSPTQNFVAGMGTGVNEIREVTEYAVVPNPSTDNTVPVLTLHLTESLKGEIRIMDGAGRILSQQVAELTIGQNNIALDADRLPAGMYFVVMTTPKGNLVERMMIAE